ncbi:MAG: hypothetical protein ACREOO_13290 [bacterium]
MMTANYSYDNFLRAAADAPPRETLLAALARFEGEESANLRRTAVELGCGAGADSLELLRQGWNVLGNTYHVLYPKTSHEESPEYEAWKTQIAKDLARLHGEVILIGHSTHLAQKPSKFCRNLLPKPSILVSIVLP